MYAHELFEQNKPRVVVTYPGRFQPFHQGHAGVFAQLQKKFGAENVYIATSNDQSSAKSPFNFSDKYQLMTAAGVPADRIIQTTAMYALPEGIDPANTIFITAVGAPDADRLNPDSVLKRDKKDKDGNVIKPAGSPGYYKTWNPKQDPLPADQHGYVIVVPEIKKTVTIKGQKYDVSHGTETRNLWNQIRDDDKARSEFLKQMYGKPSQELASIFDKIPQTASEDIVADNGDSTSPIRGGQIYEAGVAEDSLIEFAPVGQGPWGDDGDADPYRYPKPKSYSRSIDFFGQFEADHFDHEDFDNDTGEFKGYWGNTQIAYFKFNNPEKTGSDDPGMGWYYEPEADSNSNNASAAPAIDNSKQRKQQELGMIDAFLKSGQTPKPGSQIYSLMKRHGLVEDSETKSLDPATVRRIQNYLNKKFNANLDVDGIMGELTLKSIRKFIPSSAKKLAPSPERNTAVQGGVIKKEEQLDEACWKGYHKEGNKKMFGKTYPNCVKNTNEEQGVAEGSTGISVRKWANQVRKEHGADVKFWNRREGGGAVDSVIAKNSQGETVGVYNRKTGYPTVFEPKQELEEKWSKKYKDSINCSNPKGFSQKAHCAGKNEDTQQDSDQLDENLKKWFKEKWVRFGPDGKIRGACARGDSSEGKPKCLPQSKAHSLGKKGRASAAAKKRREDPNPERRGSAINVATKTKSNEDASGVIATKKQARDPRYSMSLTKDVRPGQIEKSLRAFKLAEGKNSNAEMFELFAKFLPLAMKDLGLTTLPKIVPELHIKSHDGQATFGRFVNDEMSIHLALANRHPVDILRTLAHELVHFKQLTLGKIKDTSGITGSPEENQANTIAGIIMRHFNKEYPDAVNMHPIELDESLVTVNYGIGKNPGKLAKVGPGGRVPHAKLHVNVDKKTAKKLGIPHLNENGDDEADEVKKQKNLIPFPKGTVKVDVSDVYDWYKLGMEISDLDDADPADFGKGPPQTVMAFGDEEQEHKYLPQLQRLGLKTHDIDEAADKCPPATQDITLNLENRQKAIDEYGYGPLNPDMPNRKFWMKKVDEWNLDSMEEAQQSLCGNCAAFDIRQETLDCIAQGIDSDNPQDAEGVIDAGDLGYCKFLKFKCASRRTCDAWVTGGPLQDKPIDENFADGRNPGDKGSLKAKVKGKVTMSKARAILKNKNSTPRAKQLAHWFINMNKGRSK